MSLVLAGYSFGESNHQVYLLDAFRIEDPRILASDWFTTHTLQYHVLFSWLTATLNQLDILRPAFFLGYLAIVLGMHLAWLGIVRKIGGTPRTYLLSVLFFHASAGGFGLGMNQFLQDGSFLPSNIAAVLMLASLNFWLSRRNTLAATCAGIAGIFHLNYALFAILLFTVFVSLDAWRDRTIKSILKPRAFLVALLVCIPSLINIANAAVSKWQHSAVIPLDDFINIYVRFRHPHHYDPSSWPLALWISYLWVIPPAILALTLERRSNQPADTFRRIGHAFVFLLLMLAGAIVFAGIFWVSETFVQMSLYRFSIFPKLIACTLTAWLILDHLRHSTRLVTFILTCIAAALIAVLIFASSANPSTGVVEAVRTFVRSHQPTLLAMLATLIVAGLYFTLTRPDPIARTTRIILTSISLSLLVIVTTLAHQNRLGLSTVSDGSPAMQHVGRWARQSTPIDAVFLIPPGDGSFRLASLRSAVVSFKHVPQLNGELLEWKRRLDDVTGIDVSTLRGHMPRTQRNLDTLYNARNPESLFNVARRYHASYLVIERDLGPDYAPLLEFTSPDATLRVYRVTPSTSSDPSTHSPESGLHTEAP
jgi:hypothetical protein